MTASDEKAVALFREYFRLNPIDSAPSIESKLERKAYSQNAKDALRTGENNGCHPKR